MNRGRPNAHLEDVDVVILNYRTSLLAVEAARSALRNGASSIAVVDSHSEDDSLTTIEREIGEFVKIIPLPNNYGFSKGNNMGARIGDRRFILFMNADTFLHDEALVEMLSVFSSNPSVGAVAPALFFPNGDPQASAYFFISPRRLANSLLGLDKLADRWKLNIFSSNQDPLHNGDFSGIVESLYGPCFLVRRKAFEDVGGFDETFFLYCEETDFFLRMTQKGWQVFRQSMAKVTHYHGESAKQVPIQALIAQQTSLRIYARKHFTVWGRMITVICVFTGYGLRYLFSRNRAARKRYRAILRSWLGDTSASGVGRS